MQPEMAKNGCSAAALVAEFRWTAPFPSTLALLLLLLVNVNVEAVYNTLQCSAVTECMCECLQIHEVASDWCSTHTTAQHRQAGDLHYLVIGHGRQQRGDSRAICLLLAVIIS